MTDNTEMEISDWKEQRKINEDALQNLTEVQWATLGIVNGILRNLVHDMRVHPDEPNYHKRENWHPLYTAYINLSEHMCMDDYNQTYFYTDGWDSKFAPYEYIKKWRRTKHVQR